MKRMTSVFICLVVFVLSAGSVYAQDLSRYRNFAFGITPAEASKLVAPQMLQTRMVTKESGIVQELTWWPLDPPGTAQPVQPVWQVLFTFYEGRLYRTLVTYNTQATKGLTVEDMVDAISTQYGQPTRPGTTISFPTNELYSSTEIVIARWEDSQYSVNLFRSSFLNTYGLILFSKQLDTQVRAAFAESLKRGKRAEDPQIEVARLKTEADGLEVTRQKNKKSFRP